MEKNLITIVYIISEVKIRIIIHSPTEVHLIHTGRVGGGGGGGCS